MTVTNLYEPNYYSGNGVTTVFSYSFTCLLASWIVVAVNGVIISNANYTVALNSNNVGGTVTFNVAPADGLQIAITLMVPDLQLTSFPVEGALPQFTLENAFDTITLITQQLTNALSRTIMQSVFAPLGLTLQIPNPIAGDLLGWDSTATTLINIPPGGPTGAAGPTGPTGATGAAPPVETVDIVFAWGEFNASGGAIGTPVNCSASNTGTGRYTVTFGATAPDAKYLFTIHPVGLAGGFSSITSATTTAITFSLFNGSGTLTNQAFFIAASNTTLTVGQGATGPTGATGATGASGSGGASVYGSIASNTLAPGSFGVDHIVHTSTGLYQVYFTTPFADTNYIVNMNLQANVPYFLYPSALFTDHVSLSVADSSGNPHDTNIYFTITGT